MAMEKERLFARVAADIGRPERPFVVGVNGAYTSGKTVFAEDLARYLVAAGYKVQLLHYDDFHNPFSAIDFTEEDEVEAFYNRAFVPEKLIWEVFAPLREKGSLRGDIACVNLGTGEYSNIVHLDIDESTIVLLEGVLLFRPPLSEYLDYRIYLDISREEIIRRAKVRDVPRFGDFILEKFETRYIPVQERYMREHDPAGQANLLIDNNDYDAPKVK